MLSLPPWVRAACTSSSAAGRVADRGEDLTDLIELELVGETVAAEQEAVAPHRLDPPQVHRHVRRHPEGPGQDVPVGMDGRLGRGQLTGPDHLLGQAVVGGDLGQLAVVEAVGAGVTHVDQGQYVVPVLVDQAHRGERGPHAPQLGVVLAVLPDDGVGLGHRLGQPGPGGLPPEGDGQGVDGQPGGHLAAGVAPHAVGHGEEGGGLDRQVLVDRADQAGVGGGARTEEGHLTSRPRRRCHPPAADRPSRGGSAR